MQQHELLQIARQKAKENGVNPQVIQQRFFLEELLSMMAFSKLSDKIVLKGGFLIEKIIGEKHRATQDLDMMFQSFEMSKQAIKTYFEELLQNSSPNGVIFQLKDMYAQHGEEGLKVLFRAKFGRMNIDNLAIDLSTNNIIHPEATVREFEKLDGTTYRLLSFPLEQIVADKLVATLKKGERNNRDKDYYDLFMFSQLGISLNYKDLGKSFYDTLLNEAPNIIVEDMLRKLIVSQERQLSWKNYQTKNPNASQIKYEDTIKAIFHFLVQIKAIESKKPKNAFEQRVEVAKQETNFNSFSTDKEHDKGKAK
ncbi:Nucleotidyl transferase AbiEii toxin, Type IV TA system [Pilibacter termitis]|uniref:Nucleotidyl transferase AbiEii toxin, Type IV TA system n=1 Tax=Pilibacter termitis TaxID=263852 RepID=A0A1T4KTM3_9ENTE|nr:nucleotidyl transferase AbiEii/AbiGii toxin family protein [Pilibacter termitis]SJZ45794.1 Nucleotidyl transferase AbiEii toxin, Type IV TA system [Pilibacter termitis]